MNCATFSGQIEQYKNYLQYEEKSSRTISKYIHDLGLFRSFLAGRELTKEYLIRWKEYLTGIYAPASVNSMLVAVNGFLEWAGLAGCKIKLLKIQRQIFARPEQELTREEYVRLVIAAEQKQDRRLALILQAICSTGIRVSELQFITVEAVREGRTGVVCKGKCRSVFLPRKLTAALRAYCRKEGIKKGAIFCTKKGNPLDRSNIWRDMKALCKSANVDPHKVFPHNLRHLFARTFYRLEKDLSHLADLLGHTNVATTRIYVMGSGEEHGRQMERMGLVLGGT